MNLKLIETESIVSLVLCLPSLSLVDDWDLCKQKATNFFCESSKLLYTSCLLCRGLFGGFVVALVMSVSGRGI